MISQQSQLQSLRYVHYFIFLCIHLYWKRMCLWKKTRETHFSLQNGDVVNNGEDIMVLGFPHGRKTLWIGKEERWWMLSCLRKRKNFLQSIFLKFLYSDTVGNPTQLHKQPQFVYFWYCYLNLYCNYFNFKMWSAHILLKYITCSKILFIYLSALFLKGKKRDTLVFHAFRKEITSLNCWRWWIYSRGFQVLPSLYWHK